jgi:hypothetical protein
MRQTYRTWSIDRWGAFTPIEMLAVTVTMTAGTGGAQLAIASGKSRRIVLEVGADSAQVIRAPVAQRAQRL